jgi:hypothetical protein
LFSFGAVSRRTASVATLEEVSYREAASSA